MKRSLHSESQDRCSELQVPSDSSWGQDAEYIGKKQGQEMHKE